VLIKHRQKSALFLYPLVNGVPQGKVNSLLLVTTRNGRGFPLLACFVHCSRFSIQNRASTCTRHWQCSKGPLGLSRWFTSLWQLIWCCGSFMQT